MKKNLVFIFLAFFNLNALPNPAEFIEMDPVEFVDSLVANVQKVSLCSFRLPFWAQVRYASAIALGAVLGHVTAVAIVNSLTSYQNRTELDFLQSPLQWSKGAIAGTMIGGLLGENVSRHLEFPKYSIAKMNKELLVIAIAHYGNEQNFIEKIKFYYASSRFAFVDSYAALERVYQTLLLSYTIFKSTKKEINQLVLSQLIFALDVVKNALLVIKSDANYAEEMKMHILLLTQQSLSAHNQIQVGAIVGNMAHR